jgi:hypothetical protein
MEYINYCSACEDFEICSGIPCADHYMRCESPVKELHDACETGVLWGDLLYAEEQMRLASRTPEEVAFEASVEIAKDKVEQAKLRAYVLGKVQKHHCHPSGKLKHKYNTKCTDFHLPGGCWAGEEGICRFMHPGDEKIYDFKGAKILRLDENGEVPKTPANMIFYSTKSTPRMVTPTKSQYKDSW